MKLISDEIQFDVNLLGNDYFLSMNFNIIIIYG